MFFIEAAFTPQNFGMQATATKLREEASNLLSRMVKMANEIVSVEAINANDFVTKYTLDAETATSFYTKIPLDTNITKMEHALLPTTNRFLNFKKEEIIALNNEAHKIVSEIIEFKTSLLDKILKCSIFTLNYPLLIDHILREAKYYLKKIEGLQNQNEKLTPQQLLEEEIFWNKIMAEHSMFIRGLLDPTEEDLLNMSNMFAINFNELTKEAKQAQNNVYQLSGITSKSMEEVGKIRKFKEQGAEGLLSCKVKSIILPLLADHVLREANHYFKLLKLANIKTNY